MDTDEDEIVHRPSEEFAAATNVRAFMDAHGIDDHDDLIERTTTDREWFWGLLPEYLDLPFYESFDAVRDDARGPQFTDWYVGGELNVAHATVDRYAEDPDRRDDVAAVWEGEDGTVREWTYADLGAAANRVANALVERGVGVGDTVALYLPMIPEVVSALYGVFMTGAIAVPIFSGFGTDATATRLDQSGARVVLTADGFYRRGDEITLKSTLDDAIGAADGDVEHVLVAERLGRVPGDADDADADDADADDADADDADGTIPWTPGRDEAWTDAVGSQSDDFETRAMGSNDPCLLLYSSGTTGEPKGVVHSHAGALVQPAKEVFFGFDLKPDDVFFWVSDIGWMMGPWSLIGTHAFGRTTLLYEGAPDHPDPDRFWELIERHDVTQFGVSPTAIRALREVDTDPDGYDLSSLRILGSTGEPWDEDSWRWFYERVGGGEAPIMNISGGTEIIGCFLMPTPDQPLKPCTLGGPGLGMGVDIVNAAGESVADANERGFLVATDSCPSMTRSLWEGDERYLEEYWSTWEDRWDHGDWARKDEDGFWFLEGRADDAINVAGRKVGPAEVEGALTGHAAVNRAAAVGVPDDTTGEAVVAYVVLEAGFEPSDDLAAELRDAVGAALGKPFRPREVLFADAFPQTQSGKVVRRAVAAAYTGEDVGDTSAIENPAAIDALRRE